MCRIKNKQIPSYCIKQIPSYCIIICCNINNIIGLHGLHVIVGCLWFNNILHCYRETVKSRRLICMYFILIWYYNIIYNIINIYDTACSEKLCFSVFCDLYFASTGLPLVIQKNGQPIGVTVHSHYFDYFESLFQRYVDGGWVADDSEKNTIFPEHPV